MAINFDTNETSETFNDPIFQSEQQKESAIKNGWNGLFYTPKNINELQNYIESLPAEEKVLAYTIYGMTANLYAVHIATQPRE